MENLTWPIVIGLVSMTVAIGTFIFAALGLRGRVQTDYVDLLQKEVQALRAEGGRKDIEIDRLRSENQWLKDLLIRRRKPEDDKK